MYRQHCGSSRNCSVVSSEGVPVLLPPDSPLLQTKEERSYGSFTLFIAAYSLRAEHTFLDRFLLKF